SKRRGMGSLERQKRDDYAPMLAGRLGRLVTADSPGWACDAHGDVRTGGGAGLSAAAAGTAADLAAAGVVATGADAAAMARLSRGSVSAWPGLGLLRRAIGAG